MTDILTKPRTKPNKIQNMEIVFFIIKKMYFCATKNNGPVVQWIEQVFPKH